MSLKSMLKLPVAALFAMVLLLVGCEQKNELPVGRSLTVMVQDASDSKTIGPAGNVNVSDYVITLSNGEMDITSDRLEKGESYTVTNIPVGMWTAKVDAYVENEAAEGGHVLVATGKSEPVHVTEGSDNTISVVIDSIIEAVSGDVTIALKLPDSFSAGSYAYVIWTIDNGTEEHSVNSWGRAQELMVGEDLTAKLILDADSLLGNDELLFQGVWDIEVTARTSRYSSTNECSGREVMRLLPGLPAEGLVDLSGKDSGEGSIDVTIGTDLGALQDFGFSIDIIPGEVSLIPVDDNPEEADEYSFHADGIRIGTSGDVWYEYIDDWNDERFVIYGLETGVHSLTIVHDDGTPHGASSVTLRFEIPQYTEITVEYDDLIGVYEIPEGHVNYGFADADGNYVEFPYTGYFEDMNEDGQVQLAEMGLRALDYPFVDGEHINVYIYNNSIIRVGVPDDESFPSLSGVDMMYITFAEGPTDLGYTVTSGEAPYENMSMRYFTGTVQYLFPRSIERFGRVGTLFSGSDQHWVFQSVVEDDLSSTMGRETWTSNKNMGDNVETIDFGESPYEIRDGLLLKTTQEGKELIALMYSLIDEAAAALVDGDRILLPDDVVAIRPFGLTDIRLIARDIEDGAVLVMPSGLKSIDAPLVTSGDMDGIRAMLFQEGFESLGYLGGDRWSTWSGANDDNSSMKIFLPSTLKEISPQEFSGEYSTPEFYVALSEDSFDWNSLLNYDSTSQDMVIYFDGEWAEGEDGVPVATKLQITDIGLRNSSGTYYLDFDDLFFARIDYRYEYTIDGSEPAEPSETSEKLDSDLYDGYSYYSGGYPLRNACPLWDIEMPLRLKIKLFSEGSGPSDTVLLTYDPS